MLSMRSAVALIGRDLVEAYRGGTRVERVCYLVAAVLAVSGIFHLGVLVATGGAWTGPLSWRKPTTFGLSFGLTLATLTWVLSFLPMARRTRARLLSAFAVACAVEVAGITMQAWRRVPSHFIPPDRATGLDVLAAVAAASGAVVIVAVVVTSTLLVLRCSGEVEPSMRLALRAGFLSLLLAMAIGALMLAGGQVLTRTQGDVAPAFAFTAVLKPGHAATMHGVLVLPAIAWLLRFTATSEPFRLTVVRLATIGYAAFAAVVVVETLAGIDPPGAAPLVAGALPLVGLAALAVAAGVTLHQIIRNPVRARDVRVPERG
ncbi:hypothetical protein FHU35_12223 [Saccharopolyspora dendranthemae]|uniref:Uncharacterized protein n=2 Tax=Saccharopolyspora dendranthemae TaxID=1181886 RepID=A0A561U790_9PSEU|nr:hypothetical protein FHU35_12223 [Saccharopolyspora dendranthemae]